MSQRPEGSLFSHKSRFFAAGLLASVLASAESQAQGTAGTGVLVSRAELDAAATRADMAAATGDPSARSQNAMTAVAIRQRLRDGDFQVGDRVVVTITSDIVRRDTAVVRYGPALELPGPIVVSLAGVLRSEVKGRVSTEVLKYVKASAVDVVPLVRLGVLGAVARPGYFAFPSDMPLSDVLMGAGGPAANADVGRSVIRRGAKEIRSASDTRTAFASGLTLDQLGLNPGDEIFVGSRRDVSPAAIAAVSGAIASVLAIVVTLRR